MFLQIIITLTFVILIYGINGWVIEVNQDHVTPQLTTDVNIECSHDPTKIQSITEVYRIRITKFNNKTNRWGTLAEISETDRVVKNSLVDATTEAFIDKPAKTFIKIHFDIATDETLGDFVCEIDGFDKYMSVINIKTKPVIINEREISNSDLLNMLGQLNKQVMNDKAELKILKEAVNNMSKVATKNTEKLETVAVQVQDDKADFKMLKETMADLSEWVQTVVIEQKQAGNELSIVQANLTKRMDKADNGLQTAINEGKMADKAIAISLANFTDIVVDLQENSVRQKEVETAISTAITKLTNKTNSFSDELISLAGKQKMTLDLIKKLHPNNSSATTTTTTCTPTTTTISAGTTLPAVTTPTTLSTTTTKPMAWPSGSYTLLKPKLGCPNPDPSAWQYSAIRISTRPGDLNGDKGAKDLHLSGNVFQYMNFDGNYHHYVNLEMCSMVSGDKDQGEGQVWPKGTYCIQIYSYIPTDGDNNCPAGFENGHIRIGRFDDKKKDYVTNLPGYAKYFNKDYSHINFCCRKDSPPFNPIVLPPERPFYLYRYKGECQQIEGMDVSYDWMLLDTNQELDYLKADKFVQPAPDGYNSRDGLRVEFCYYAPRDGKSSKLVG